MKNNLLKPLFYRYVAIGFVAMLSDAVGKSLFRLTISVRVLAWIHTTEEFGILVPHLAAMIDTCDR
jgi:hypothetical protein